MYWKVSPLLLQTTCLPTGEAMTINSFCVYHSELFCALFTSSLCVCVYVCVKQKHYTHPSMDNLFLTVCLRDLHISRFHLYTHTFNYIPMYIYFILCLALYSMDVL